MGWQRPLTGLERWLWLFDRAAPMNLVFVARVSGRFDPVRLNEALAAVAAHYPVLTARIEPTRRPRFVATRLDVPVRTQGWEAGGWREAAVGEVNTRVPAASGPLARALVLDGDEESDLLLTLNQACVDGLSGAHILDEVLHVYGGGARPAVAAPEVLDPPLTGHLGSRFAALRHTLREIPAMRRLARIEADRRPAPELRRTALIDVELPRTLVDALADQARARASSVHGAVAAAVLLAVGAELRGGRHARRFEIGCATPIDLRRRVELPGALVGNLISRLVSGHLVHYDTLFWDLAADVSEALREATGSGAALAYTRMKERAGIGVSDRALPRRVRRSERYDRAAAVINNLGALEYYPRYGDVTLQRLGFLASANAGVGSALVLSMVTLGDTCTLNFTFADPLVDSGCVLRIVDRTLERLREAL